MIYLNKVLPYKLFNMVTGFGLLLSASLVFTIAGQEPARAFLLGYGFYWANISALIYLGGLLFSGVVGQHTPSSRKSLRNLGMLMGVLKFAGSLAVLFVLISVLKLDPVYLISGIFTSMIATGILMSFYNFKYLNENRKKLDQDRETLKKERAGQPSLVSPPAEPEISFSSMINKSRPFSQIRN